VQKHTLGEVGNWTVVWWQVVLGIFISKSYNWFSSYSRKCRGCFLRNSEFRDLQFLGRPESNKLIFVAVAGVIEIVVANRAQQAIITSSFASNMVRTKADSSGKRGYWMLLFFMIVIYAYCRKRQFSVGMTENRRTPQELWLTTKKCWKQQSYRFSLILEHYIATL